jgi:hypothetical protein
MATSIRPVDFDLPPPIAPMWDARKLDYYHELEARERTRVFTLGDLAVGLEDAAAGRVQSVEQLRESMKTRHARLRSRAKG